MKNSTLLVSIIIVNWNGKENLKQCLESIDKQKYPNYETVVVDNASSDGSVPYLRKLEKSLQNLTVVENETNTGFAEGNNIGYQEADGEFILFLNNDALLTPGSLSHLVKVLSSDKKLGAIQPTIMQYPNQELVDSIGSYLLKTGFLYHKGHNKSFKSEHAVKNYIFTMKGACMLIKKEVLEKVGAFDNDYFAYFEETDLCHRIWLSGYKIMYDPGASVWHKGGESSSNLPTPFITFHSYKNRIQTYLKNFQIRTLLLILPIHITLCLIASLMYLAALQFRVGISVLKGIGWNIINFKAILKKRKRIQSSVRSIQDKDYLPLVQKTVRPDYYYHLFTTSLRGYDD